MESNKLCPIEDTSIKSPSFSLELQSALRELKLNPRKFSLELKRDNGDTGFAYDHVRKVYNGQTFPGREMLRAMCDYLGLDPQEMWKKVKADEAVFKGLAEALTNDDRLLLKVQRYWDYLGEIDKEEILSSAQHRAELRIKRAKQAELPPFD